MHVIIPGLCMMIAAGVFAAMLCGFLSYRSTKKSRLIEYRRLNDCKPGCFMMNLPVMLTERVRGVAISERLPRFWR